MVHTHTHTSEHASIAHKFVCVCVSTRQRGRKVGRVECDEEGGRREIVSGGSGGKEGGRDLAVSGVWGGVERESFSVTSQVVVCCVCVCVYTGDVHVSAVMSY